MILWSAVLLIRFLIASILIMFLPGFALQLALFPRAKVDRAERAFLIISMSVALSSLAAVTLVWTPVGLQPWSFGLVIILITVLLSATAVVRHGGRHAYRTTLPEAAQVLVSLRRNAISSRHMIELPLFLLALVILVGIALLRGESSTRVTEFYFPPEKLSSLMVQAQQAQAQFEIPFEIANGAPQSKSFRVEVWSNGSKLTERDAITVDAESAKQTTIEVPTTNIGRHALELRLYNTTQSVPVARLRLQRGTVPSANTAQQ